MHGERAQIIDAVDVIGMFVRKEHGVDMGHARRHELQPQFGRCVDQEARAIFGFDDGAAACAFVARVGRLTHGAVAADLRDTEAGAGAQKPEAHGRVPHRVRCHTVSTLSRFVVPGTSKGTPAVTSTRSPLVTIPRSRASRSAMATM